MRFKPLLALMAAAILCILGWALLAPTWFQSSADKLSAVAAVQTHGPEIPPATAANPAMAPAKSVAKGQAATPDLPPYEDNPLAEHEVVLRLAEVADQYAQDIQYPPTSEPIADSVALQKYLPDRSFTASEPIEPQNPNSPRLSLLTDKTRYFTGEDILATVQVDGAPAGASIAVSGRLLAQGRELLRVDSVGNGQGYGLVYALSTAPGIASGELRVVAQVSIDGKSYELGTPVQYVASMASIVSVGSATVQNEYLVIPVQVTTSNPGYHEVSGNLYSARSGQPLIHLSTQEEVAASGGVLSLHAHIRALKAKGDAGPYVLKDLQIMRMPSPPDFTSSYGRSVQPAYAVQGFPFSDYNDIPYVDEEAQQRLAFLRGRTGTP